MTRGQTGAVVVLGATGMVGTAWRRLLGGLGIEAAYPSSDEVRFERISSLDAFVAGGATIVNCVAYTDVDGAETDEATANLVNADAVAYLARLCAQREARLVHYSTDYVFPGDGETPYACDAPISPVNAYGRSKALGEAGIVDAGGVHLIVRTSWVYAPWGKNFVRTMFRLGGERSQLQVVDDQRGRPTSATHLAETTWKLLNVDATGFFHVTDGGEATWFDLASRVMERAKLPCRVTPCTTDQFRTPAARPRYSVLDIAKTEALVGPMAAWRANVDSVVNRLLA